MSDVHTPEQRRRNMAAIRGRDTKPEMAVRRLVHRMRLRDRLHGRRLPGHPDLVFASRRKVIFVHGCFWHLHDCRLGAATPTTNATFWAEKRTATARRDARVRSELERAGWRVIVVWECE